ncbi:hypothetical protein GSI_07288 [Ganoderma sinense ZZ0214-1]|uniref:F-box domain-containing protein n=1 Tax=Ganoderma sinense ZZ0214-1 TaxID=1077348 RepID=A0A2G8SA22_9APHY|nr:hypothetical protein GSI_07288 [Ganoderma sinense ZZ0214-1]
MSRKRRATSLLQETIETREDGSLGSHQGNLTAKPALQSCPTLPLELEHMIIGHLHGNLVALKAASLVCKDWTKAARRHLFHTVELAGVNQLLRFSADVPLIPDIRESVQVLEIRGEGDQLMAAPQPLPTYVNFVVDTVASMPRLLELHFVSAPMVFKPFAINPPRRSSLRFLAFTMRNCSPEDFQCMLHIVGLFSDISSLIFSMIDPMNVDGQAMPSPEKLLQAGVLPSYGPVKLRCLEIMGINHHWLPLLLCTLRHVGALRDRTLAMHLWPNMVRNSDMAVEAASATRTSLEGYGAFFGGLGPALRLLDVDLLYPIAAAREQLNGNLFTILGLSACTNLQWLSLYLDVPNDLDDAQVILASTLRAYTEILATTHFPALNFVALHLIADGATDEDELFYDLDWSLLTSALLGLPALFRFVIYMRCNRPRAPMGGRYLQDLMPLHRAGKFILIHAKEDASGQQAIPVLHPESRDRGILLAEGRQ